jgi:WD40 repeat protein
MKIMAVAYESGVIKMYQMDGSKKYLLDLKGHQSTCQSIYISSSNPYFLYSASTDSTVRIWNLRDYEQVYMLQLDVLIDEITFITESLLFINKKELRGKSYLCQINTNLLDPIVNDNRGEHLIKMKCDLDWCVRIYSNNLVEFSSILNQEKNMGN